MSHMKTILVGTDFPPSSDRALRKATEIAGKAGAKIYLLHVLEPVDDPDSEDPDTQAFYRDLKKKAEEKFARQLRSADLEAAETAVLVGTRHATLLSYADDIEADLIVLGSTPISIDSMRVSTSHRAAVTSPRPVLLVPN